MTYLICISRDVICISHDHDIAIRKKFLISPYCVYIIVTDSYIFFKKKTEQVVLEYLLMMLLLTCCDYYFTIQTNM